MGDGSRTGGTETLALALLDVSTGDFLATSSRSPDAIADEVSRFDPAEAVLGPNAPRDVLPRSVWSRRSTPQRSTASAPPRGTTATPTRCSRRTPKSAPVARSLRTRSTSAAANTPQAPGATTRPHLSPSRPTPTNAVGSSISLHLTRYDPREYLLLDAVALRSLELFEPRAVHGRDDATLVGVLDETASALGGRTLRDWLRRPLLEPDRIESRLDAVEELTGAVQTREELHDHLRDVYDLERLIGRISRERANARDLRSLRATLAVVPEIRQRLVDADCDRLQRLHDELDPLVDVREAIDEAIVENPPIEITEGDIIADGYDDGLDELRATARDGKQWIEDLEERERERTGIDSLKVGYNSVHGYYIEVTNPNLESVPDDYERRQTLKNSERFVTPELKRREDEIVGAEERADEREYDLFCEVRRDVADEVERVQALANAVATSTPSSRSRPPPRSTTTVGRR